jgi:drug/metabolite transporter (DMT)-like permease
MKKQTQAELLLLMTTMFWGTSYLLTKIGLVNIEPFNLTALRFVIAFILAIIVLPSVRRNITRKLLFYSAVLGGILFIVFATMTYGVKYTSASNAGFLMSLTMVFIPLLSWLIFKRNPPRKVLISVAIATVGIALLTLTESLSIGTGDFLCILCALCCALHILITDIFTKKVDSFSLGVLQIGFVGFYSLVASILLETPRLPSTANGWIAVLGLSILCTAIGFIAQTYAQQYTSPSRAGLIFALEAVFSAIFSYIFLSEILSSKGYLGAGLVFFSLIFMEVDFKRFRITKPFKKAA